MIKIGLDNIKEFKSILSVAEVVFTEIKFEIDNDGLRFRGMDGGHTSYFEANFKKEYFTTYQLDMIDNIIIDTYELNKIFKRVKAQGETYLIIDNNNLIIKCFYEDNEKVFKLNSIDMEYDSPRMPYIEYPVSINTDLSKFKENVTDANLYEDKLRLKVEENNLIIYNDNMIGSYESRIKLKESYDECSSVFSMGLINKFFKLNTLSNDVKINMGSNMPILLTLTDSFEYVVVKLLIAPIIEEDY